LESVHRQHLRADLVAALKVKDEIEALARRDAVVMAALGADVEVLLEIRAIEHCLARLAFAPQPLGYRLPRAAIALDLRRQQFLQPAHAIAPFVTRDASIAARTPERNAVTAVFPLSRGEFSISCTSRLPMMTASENSAMRRAVSPSRIPNPTPIGSRVKPRMCRMRAAT